MRLPKLICLPHSGRPTLTATATASAMALLSLGAVVTQAANRAEVSLVGVGDLPGGIVYSEVRDAVRVGGVTYAVGSSAAHDGSTGGDTAILWTSTEGLQALPNLVENNVGTSFVTASAITPDAAFIASRARSQVFSNARLAVRVARTNKSMVNLGAAPGITPNSAAVCISADGSVLYGFGNGGSRAFRFEVAGPTATLIPLLAPTDAGNFPSARGCSADGSVMVGNSGDLTNSRAFRYVHGKGVTALPLLPGGTSSEAIGLTPDGVWTLLDGTSPRFPRGEIFLHHSGTGQLRQLGSPNEAWYSFNSGGITADASVVVAIFGTAGGNDAR